MAEPKAPDRAAATRAMRSLERAFLLGIEGVTEILLIRHADAYDGLDPATDPASDGDPGLSAAGREQARRLAERLGRFPVDAVFASPLRRARETAEAIGLPVTLDDRLVEVAADTTGGYVELQEVPAETIRRMRAAIEQAVARHPGGRVAIVGHGVAILHYLCDVLRIEPGRLRVLPYYTSINVVRIKDDRRMAGSIADVAHLEGLAWLS
ncbi:MAG: histidine phosphatase family protein [Chloroflexota bacterium]